MPAVPLGGHRRAACRGDRVRRRGRHQSGRGVGRGVLAARAGDRVRGAQPAVTPTNCSTTWWRRPARCSATRAGQLQTPLTRVLVLGTAPGCRQRCRGARVGPRRPRRVPRRGRGGAAAGGPVARRCWPVALGRDERGVAAPALADGAVRTGVRHRGGRWGLGDRGRLAARADPAHPGAAGAPHRGARRCWSPS